MHDPFHFSVYIQLAGQIGTVSPGVGRTGEDYEDMK